MVASTLHSPSRTNAEQSVTLRPEFPSWRCNKQPDNCGHHRAHSNHTLYTEYLSKTYPKIISKQRFGRPTSYPIDTMHNQVCQRNQGFQCGIQLSLIQNIFVGLKYAGQNLLRFSLSYHCAHNGLSLEPSSLLRHTLLSRTDYDSSLIPIVTHY
jgi:hypothetical protein